MFLIQWPSTSQLFSRLLTSNVAIFRFPWTNRLRKNPFVTHEGSYSFCRLPFGLRNAPASFQQTISSIFRKMLFSSVLIYIDDVLIFSQSFKIHMQTLKQVFDLLRNAKLRLHPNKCNFAAGKILYLGHILSSKGVEIDKTKVEIVQNFPRPKNQKQLRSFLGLCIYFRRFVKGHSIISAPLNQLLRKNVNFEWSDDCETAFKNLKHALPPLRF